MGFELQKYFTTKPPVGTPINWGDPITNGLVSCVPYNEGAGTPRDIVAPQFGLSSTLPTWQPSRKGLTAGVAKYDNSKTEILNFSSGPFTIASFVNVYALNTNGNFPSLIRRYHDNGNLDNGGWSLFIYPPDNASTPNRFTFDTQKNDSNPYPGILDSGINHGIGDWFVVGTSNTLSKSIYINGRFCASHTANPNPVREPNNPYQTNGAGVLFPYIHYCWSRELSPTEILRLYQNPYCIFYQSAIPIIYNPDVTINIDPLVLSSSVVAPISQISILPNPLTGTFAIPTPSTSPAGPKNPGTFVSTVGDLGSGTAWTNPGNAAASDDTYATVTLALGANSEYLKATNFGFTIPDGLTVLGIKVEIEQKTSLLNSTTDYAVRLVKGGTIQSTERKNAGQWPTADAFQTYGSESDLWGTTLTPADVRDATFGVAIAAIDSALATASIDNIRMTIFSSAGVSVTVNINPLTLVASVVGVTPEVKNIPAALAITGSQGATVKEVKIIPAALPLTASQPSSIPTVIKIPLALSLSGSVSNATPVITFLASALGMAASLGASISIVTKIPGSLTGSFSLQAGTPMVIVLPSGLTATFTVVPFAPSGVTNVTVILQALTMSVSVVAPAKEVKVLPLSLLVNGSVQAGTKEVKIAPNALTLAIATNTLTPEVKALIGPQSLNSFLGGTVPNVISNITPLNISAVLVSPAISIIFNTTVILAPLTLTMTLGGATAASIYRKILQATKHNTPMDVTRNNPSYKTSVNKQSKRTIKSNVIKDVERDIQSKAVTKHQI